MFAVTSCHDGGYRTARYSGVVWGTTYSITCNTAAVDNPDYVDAAINASLTAVGDVANAFDPTSELSRLNVAGQLSGMSSRMSFLVQRSRYVSAISDGAFDPTIGPLVDLWGFGAGAAADSVTDADVARVRALVGMDGVIVDGDDMHFARPGMRLDFAAIAKGYGVDCVADTLAALGVTDYLVEIGGEVRAAGVSPRNTPWRVQIDAPVVDNSANHNRLTVIELTDAAVATSGNYRNFRTSDDGSTVAHIISPVTGRPATTDVLSATIIAADATTADALATAAMVLGKDAANRLLTRLSADASTGVYGAILVTGTPDGYDTTTIGLPNPHAACPQ